MPKRGAIVVAAGINGAGKSTIVGRYIAQAGGAYYNPDLRTREWMAAGLDEAEANRRSWQEGFDALNRATDEGASFTFESTLGGKSVAAALFRALALRRSVTIYFVGLESVELHLQRVAARVRRGGHDIPADKIRERFVTSRENLLSFIGTQANLRMWDNSEEDPDGEPLPVEVLRIVGNHLQYPDTASALKTVPGWARAFVQRAFEVCEVPPSLKPRRRPRRR